MPHLFRRCPNLKSGPPDASPRAGFYFDELVFREDDGSVDHPMTALAAIEDDEKFEKAMMLIRASRTLAGVSNQSIPNWHTYALCRTLQRCFFVGCFNLFLLLSRTNL